MIVGYCATGSAFIDTSPAITMMSETTVAKIGRSMKNLENTRRPSYLSAFAASAAGVWFISASVC